MPNHDNYNVLCGIFSKESEKQHRHTSRISGKSHTKQINRPPKPRKQQNHFQHRSRMLAVGAAVRKTCISHSKVSIRRNLLVNLQHANFPASQCFRIYFRIYLVLMHRHSTTHIHRQTIGKAILGEKFFLAWAKGKNVSSLSGGCVSVILPPLGIHFYFFFSHPPTHISALLNFISCFGSCFTFLRIYSLQEKRSECGNL